MITRRTLLITGGSALAVTGITAANLLHSNLSSVRAPWHDVGQGFVDLRLNALSYAILAPSPHNRQPWLVELVGSDELVLYADVERLLPETDPYNRQITVGLGAFLELLTMAANGAGYGLKIDLFPEGAPTANLDDKPVAHVRFGESKTIQADPLFEHVLNRRTNRAPFDQNRHIKASVLTALKKSLSGNESLFDFTTNTERVRDLKSICKKSWEIEISTPRTHKESTRLTRIGEKQIKANPDGITLSGPMIEGLKLSGIITVEKMNDPKSRAFAETKKFYDNLIDSSMGFGWLISKNNSRASQIRAGAHWLRIHLAATQQGLSFQPLSQALQEFPEMADLYREIHSLLGVKAPRKIQGLFRFGYAKSPPPAPRWPLQSRLINEPV